VQVLQAKPESGIGTLSDLWGDTIAKHIKSFRFIIYYKKHRREL
jgi:hypothetical protein